ncbi:MAG: hypothetical protein JXB00_15610 [Bacteroidales bacterium]|nr:hypothetical protein [Bacteroidales bacterium]
MKKIQTSVKSFTLLAVLISLHVCTGIKAQENAAGNHNNNQSLVEVNKEMIDRFNNCKTDSMLVSWSELVIGFDRENLSNLMLAYLNADFENQSLEDIKLALDNKQTEHLDNSNIINDLAWFNRVKQEINSKLRVADMVAGR